MFDGCNQQVFIVFADGEVVAVCDIEQLDQILKGIIEFDCLDWRNQADLVNSFNQWNARSANSGDWIYETVRVSKFRMQ